MKALTVQQPYASLIASGQKTIELRSWSTMYRGPLLIHAGKRLHSDYRNRLLPLLPRGVIVCVVDLVDVRPYHEGDRPNTFVKRRLLNGFFSWVLENARGTPPIPIDGHQRLFDVPVDVHVVT